MALNTDYVDVYNAWETFRKGKKPSRAIDEFAYSLEENIANLSNDLNCNKYKHGSYQKVVVQEKKRRDLAVATVRDRIVHRLLYDYLVAKYDKSFDPDVWSCRKGKGLHKCLKRTQQLLAKHNNSYIWRADISKFFDNVDHIVLKAVLSRTVIEEQTRNLLDKVIASYNCQSVSQSVSQSVRYTYWQFNQPDFL